MSGTLFGVGIGPGDPELITLKAVKTIERCPIIAVPKAGEGERMALNIARQAVPGLTDKTLIELDMPMTRDKALLRRSHLAAAEQIADYLKAGQDVAFLTLGDPSVYSTYIYVHRIVKEKGGKTEIIPGVPSFCAVSARLNDGLVETSESLHVIPGSYGELDDDLRRPGTKVLMKCGKSFSAVRQMIRDAGLYENAKMVENCGLETERVYDSLADADESAGYFSVIVIKDKA